MATAIPDLEAALLAAIKQARTGHQTEMAVSLSMMLESLRRQNDSAGNACVGFIGHHASL